MRNGIGSLRSALVSVLALALGAVGGYAYVWEVEWFLLEQDPRLVLPPCFEVGTPFHHRFLPHCSGTMVTPEGPVRVEVNGDGLREIERKFVLRRPYRIAVVGDSFVEGWWVSNQQSLPVLLSEKLPKIFFLNGGLRSTGPMMQAVNLRELIRVYRPASVIWLVNDTDPLEDRFTCAVTENPDAPIEEWRMSAPEFHLNGWRETIVHALGATAAAARLRQHFYQGEWLRLAKSQKGESCGKCKGVRALKKVADEAGLPVQVFYVPLNPSMEGAMRVAGGARKELFDCLAESGLAVKVMGARFGPDLYWDQDIHLRPEGLLRLAEEIVPALSAKK